MLVRPLSISQNISSKNHREAPAVKALRWFWRFSQFYGEYMGRAPQARQQWYEQQLTEEKSKRRIGPESNRL